MPNREKFCPVCDVRIDEVDEAVCILDFIVDAYNTHGKAFLISEGIAERAYILARHLEFSSRHGVPPPPLDFSALK